MHYIFVISISNKSFDIIKREFIQWIAAIERQNDYKVKCLYMNEESEYQDHLKSILRVLDIKHEKTSSHISEFNDKAKRLNHILNDIIKVMLIHVNLSYSFWVKAMIITIYLKNRLSSEAINDDIFFQW